MSLYYCPVPRILRRREMLVASTFTVVENRLLTAKLKHLGVVADEPPFSEPLKSKVLPRMMFPVEVAHEIPGTAIHAMFFPVLFWMVKKDFYENHSRGPHDEKGLRKCDQEIRAKLVQLIQFLEVDDDLLPIPGTNPVDLESTVPEIKSLNNILGKFDLGRRHDLNYGQPVSEVSELLSTRYRKIEARERQLEQKYADEERNAEIAKLKGEPVPDLEETPFERFRRLQSEKDA